eukprot:1156831-Pelagomonas_calceolata.AAC.9
MSLSYHLHAHLLKGILALISTSDLPIYFYKGKSRNGVLGKEGADALVLQAAKMPDMADTSMKALLQPRWT